MSVNFQTFFRAQFSILSFNINYAYLSDCRPLIVAYKGTKCAVIFDGELHPMTNSHRCNFKALQSIKNAWYFTHTNRIFTVS